MGLSKKFSAWMDKFLKNSKEIIPGNSPYGKIHKADIKQISVKIENLENQKRLDELKRENILDSLRKLEKRMVIYKTKYESETNSVVEKKEVIFNIKRTGKQLDDLNKHLRFINSELRKKEDLISQMERALSELENIINEKEYDKIADILERASDIYIGKEEALKDLENQIASNDAIKERYYENDPLNDDEFNANQFSTTGVITEREEEEVKNLFEKHIKLPETE